MRHTKFVYRGASHLPHGWSHKLNNALTPCYPHRHLYRFYGF